MTLVCVTEILEREEGIRQKKTLQEIMTENFLNLVIDIKFQPYLTG